MQALSEKITGTNVLKELADSIWDYCRYWFSAGTCRLNL